MNINITGSGSIDLIFKEDDGTVDKSSFFLNEKDLPLLKIMLSEQFYEPVETNNEKETTVLCVVEYPEDLKVVENGKTLSLREIHDRLSCFVNKSVRESTKKYIKM